MYLIHSLPKSVKMLLTSPYLNINLSNCNFFLLFFYFCICSTLLLFSYISVIFHFYCYSYVCISCAFALCPYFLALEARVVESNSLCVEAYGNKARSDSNTVKSMKSVLVAQC